MYATRCQISRIELTINVTPLIGCGLLLYRCHAIRHKRVKPFLAVLDVPKHDRGISPHYHGVKWQI